MVRNSSSARFAANPCHIHGMRATAPHKLPLEYPAILGKRRGERMHSPGGLGIWQHRQRQGRRVPALHGERCTCSLPFLPLQRLPRFMRFASPLTVLLALLCEGERRALCPQAQQPAGKPRGTSSFFASVVCSSLVTVPLVRRTTCWPYRLYAWRSWDRPLP